MLTKHKYYTHAYLVIIIMGKKVGKVVEIPVDSELIESARKVLDGNWNGKFTLPSATLYPHQWSWDSCFIAIGNSYFNTDRAMKELEYLFDAQWKNGMIPPYSI
jgi:hypothetical protein